MIRNIFFIFFLFSFVKTHSKSSAFVKKQTSINLNGFNFISQKIKESDKIRVWRYLIAKDDLEVLEASSKLGLSTEDDIVVFLQFLFIQLKQQNIHHNFVKSMGIKLILDFENSFPQYIQIKTNSVSCDSDVVQVYEYIIYKDEDNIDQKIKTLCTKAKKDNVFVKNCFRSVGEISILAFKGNSIKKDFFIAKGSINIMEESDCYKIYYIDSDIKSAKLNLDVKVEIKDLFSSIIDNVNDLDASDIEN